jgi:hypothetical protein
MKPATLTGNHCLDRANARLIGRDSLFLGTFSFLSFSSFLRLFRFSFVFFWVAKPLEQFEQLISTEISYNTMSCEKKQAKTSDLCSTLI